MTQVDEPNVLIDDVDYAEIKWVTPPTRLDGTPTGIAPRMRHLLGCGHFFTNADGTPIGEPVEASAEQMRNLPACKSCIGSLKTVWGIHNDQASIDPVADGAVRIGWDELPDLSTLEPTRDAFKAAVVAAIPDVAPARVPGWAGTLYRFVHEIRVGDIIVSPNRAQRTLNIGRVSGPYEFHADADVHPHWRPVKWIRVGVPRDELSESAANELKSLITLFKLTTGREEIEHLLADPEAGGPADFTWTTFYAELADALMPYADDHQALLEKVWTLADNSGVGHLFKYLKADQRLDGTYGPLRDVDPFTVFSCFNRGIRSDARATIARAFRESFGIAASSPTKFSGVPIANNLRSWFIRREVGRGENEIESLWDLAAAAIAYAASANEETRERLVTTFDDSAYGNTRLLTMGLFWIRPDTFVAYDSANTAFLKKHFPDLASKLTLTSKITGEQFLANTEILNAWLASEESPYKEVWELSDAAWRAGATDEASIDPEPQTEAEPTTPEVGTDIVLEPEDPYDVASIREDGCFLSEAELAPMLERLRSKKNLVLQGPPGTGKTWLARRLGWALCNQRLSDRVQILQFHPSLAYEDFVRGWRPSSTQTGGGLSLEDGPFLQMCSRAAKDPANEYVLVIEEINRGNPAQVLGELLTLIEADKRSEDSAMRLAYPRHENERFHVPSNLYLIGTMNVADRSLAMVDMALRRRFAFIELRPALDADWVEWVSGMGYDPQLLETYGQRVASLNEQIANDNALGRQYCIGHSYFTPAVRLEATGLSTSDWWQRVVKTDVQPLLEEYWFDRPELAEEACRKLAGA